MTDKLLICDCMGSQTVDADGLTRATGRACSRLYSSLCTDQIDLAAKAMADGPVTIACQQEAPRFAALAEELGCDVPGFVDIRDRAGWTEAGENPTPKMAALVAEAALPVPLPKTIDVTSEGTCLILGPAEVALQAARDLSDTLAVTVLLADPQDAEHTSAFDIVVGRIKQASGSLGQFELRLDALQQVIPGGRGTPRLTAPQNGARSACDIILDLTGGQPMFPAPEKREGYLRADPGSQPALAAAKMAAVQLTGTFEQPLYVRLEPSLCAHSRAGQAACSNCLNLCPTGAISSAGDHVAIDPMICAGCGACSAACPSGAISYDAPTVDTVFRRIQTLASTYRKAGGDAPRLLVHDAAHGTEMIALAARFGRGLPADVIPLEVAALSGFGHAEMLAALSAGFASVDVLLGPRTERDALDPECALACAIAGRDAVHLLDIGDPDALSDHLYAAVVTPAAITPVLPIGTRRQVARLAGKTLQPQAQIIDLPAAAPYGAVLVDTDACTLCLSCVSLCPSGALGDNPDLPQLRFQEDACLQCGLCANICPENAITLEPRLNLTDAAFTQVVVHEEDPFACIECGSLFGVKSTVEKITEKLAGKHAMFANSEAARMIQMCDNCRINAQYHSQNNPFAGGERPRPRTTDDYLSKRKDH
ncbi:4Fe-4S binding protein [Sulfitobacter sabulilitoris]|uniref:4Fe-4S dicluster domain-containing protein n=1 Tax=Sulfitobacter sabulilitoris TaxID=2562655 RepID=A0A5S3PDQ3_9RHOB|nr:4Fe-4S binding protein [Sulfitobacter sabulilitoris]TMM51079.1 4Fe-4S dicluster domain-containing protein [Sulfitobacter sabulilitoris]